MFRLTEEKLKKLAEIEGWGDFYVNGIKERWIEDPIYVWGGKDEKEVFDYLKEKGYKWSDGIEIERFDPGWTWGYPVVMFLEKGGLVSYTPVEFGEDAYKEPSLD